MSALHEPITPELLQAQGWKLITLPGHMGQIGGIWTLTSSDAPWRFGIRAQAHHLNPIGLVHGGVLLTLLDHAISTVVWESSQRVPCVTVQLDSQFVSAMREGEFGVVAVIPMHRSKSMAFMRAELHVGDRMVLSGQAIIKVMKAAAPVAAVD